MNDKELEAIARLEKELAEAKAQLREQKEPWYYKYGPGDMVWVRLEIADVRDEPLHPFKFEGDHDNRFIWPRLSADDVMSVFPDELFMQ